MSLVERYIFRMAASAFLAALGGLTGVIWITQAMKDFDLLTTKGQSLYIYLFATTLVLPSLVMVIAPVALFAAILFTLNKLNGDSELIVMSASGLSPVRLAKPFVALTLAVAVLVGAMALWLMPESFGQLRNLMSQVRSDFLARVLREGQFSALDQGFTFHFRERGPNGELLGIFMQDRRDPNQTNTYIAESGLTVATDKENFLVLEKGSIQRQNMGSRDPMMVMFDRYAIDLAQFGGESEGAPLKPRERGTKSLFNPNLNDPYVKANIRFIRAELHERLVNPLYALVFGAVAFAALAQARTTRQGRGLAIAGAIGVVVLVRGAGFGVAALAARYDWAVAGLYLLPILAIVIALTLSFRSPGSPRAGRPKLQPAS